MPYCKSTGRIVSAVVMLGLAFCSASPFRVSEKELIGAINRAEKSLKIYVYGNPAQYHGFDHTVCNLDHYFSMERHIVQHFKSSVMRTTDPDKADLFLISHNIICASYDRFITNHSTQSLVAFEREFITPVFDQFVSSEYFKRSHGHDHVFPYVVDNGMFCDGSIGHLPGPLQPRYSKFLENVSIIGYYGMSDYSPFVKLASNFSVNGCFRVNQDIVIPQHHRVNSCYDEIISNLPWRKFLAFFRGAIRTDGICSPGSRIAIQHISSNHEVNGELSYQRGSTSDAMISLNPAGAACWSSRLYASICDGSVPLLIKRNVIEPFERFFDWKSFSMKLDVEHIYDSHRIFDTLKNHYEYNATKSKWKARTNEAKELQRNVLLVRRWFGWKEKASRNSWRLITLELYCRTAHGLATETLCRGSSSEIAKMTYMLGEDYYFNQDNAALGDVPPPHLDPTHPHHH